jgi:hypothetical protein
MHFYIRKQVNICVTQIHFILQLTPVVHCPSNWNIADTMLAAIFVHLYAYFSSIQVTLYNLVPKRLI